MQERGQLVLYEANRERFAPGLPEADDIANIACDWELDVLEHEYLASARQEVERAAALAPKTPTAFLSWFEALRETGPGQGDPLFPWLAQHASLDEMRWFLAQESAGEAGFDDLVAMTQVKMPTRVKLELARNYWDELGRGREGGMHGPMLERMSQELALGARLHGATPVEESLALANLMIGFASKRCYAFHSIGALGVIELSAPARAAQVNAGLKRLGVPPHTRQYFALHATLDLKHSAAWNAEVIAPLIEEDPRRCVAIAEGALMRLRAGLRCFERYRGSLFAAPDILAPARLQQQVA